mgnify:CR=1 FL=1
MARHALVRTLATAFVFSGMAVACGGAHPAANPASPADPKTKAAATPGREVHEQVTPKVCAARAKLAQLLGHTAPAPTPNAEDNVESAPPPTSVAANTKVASNVAYRAVAPGTVLIRTDSGMGTGVVIDPKGYVLTNYHVVDDGKKEDFVISADVTFGDLTPTGRMHRQEKTYDAVVVKADPIRDMAILKVKDPPAKLVTVKLAKSAPQIAEKVISVGHAGIGFLWAAKACNVASIGERQEDMSRLAMLDCSRVDPAVGSDQAKRQKKACEDQKKTMKEALNASTQGLAIQTDCAITHGDSGGPLVNGAGELVGLNQSISADMATASFHVHLDEIREFIATHAEDGIAILPDPYCDGGMSPTLEDLDLDGVPDTLVSKESLSLLGGYGRMSVLIDLDQDQFTKKKDSGASFAAEIALVRIHDTAYIWYDTDSDGRFDLLLVDKDNDGKPELAYRLDAEGRAKPDKEALPKHDFSAKLVTNAALHARLGKIAVAIGGSTYASRKVLAAASSTLTVPDPALAGGSEGRAYDTDHDGKADTVAVRGAFSTGFLVDADEDSLGSLKTGDAADELIKAKKIDAEIAVVTQGNVVWAFYDTDNDGKFDLALMGGGADSGSSLFTTAAWHVSANGERTPASDQVGRRLLRPGLITMPRAEKALGLAMTEVASDEGLGSLPNPNDTHGLFRVRDVAGAPKGTMVVEARSLTGTATLIDLDQPNAPKKPATMTSPDKVVRDGAFDAEVAVVHRGDAEWVYYDSDNDGKFDLVLFAPASGQDPTQAYRLTKNATALEVDKSAIAGKPFRHKSVFKDKALAAKWKTVAGKMFKSTSIED